MPHSVEKQSIGDGPAISPLAGKPAPQEMLIDPERLQRDYFERTPEVSDPNQLVALAAAQRRATVSTCCASGKVFFWLVRTNASCK